MLGNSVGGKSALCTAIPSVRNEGKWLPRRCGVLYAAAGNSERGISREQVDTNVKIIDV